MMVRYIGQFSQMITFLNHGKLMNRTKNNRAEAHSKMKRATLKHSGFSMIELMTTIAIIGILSGIAIPSLINLAPNYRLKAAVRELYSDMQNARIEAIKTNFNATILFQPGTYSPAGQVGNYRISIDSNGNGSYDAGETIQKSMPKNVSLISTSFDGNTAGFTPRGISLEVISPNVQLQNNQSRYYKITLSPAGALRINTSNDGETWN